MKRFLISLLFTATLAAPAVAKQPNVLNLKENITDESIVYPETFERDTQKLLEGWYLKNYTASDDRYSRQSDPEVSDETIKRRLKAMPTIIDMPFNQIVRDYIKRYTGRGREQVAAILGLSLYYTPIFEQALEAAGLPLELKYLPVIESALDPNAVSKHGATGLWQLTLGTGKGLGLEVNSLVDQRRDPYLSSQKAAEYLKELYDTYGDWSLAIAAYNCGPGSVNKALRRAGGDPKSHDFWSIYQYLSPETRGYVPMFIAANYVMTYHKDHNISPVLATKPLITDTVAVNDRLHFKQISDVLNMPMDELRILNPQFRADLIPASPEHPYFLILPSQQVHAYLVSEQEIYAYEADKYRQRETAEPGDLPVEAYEPATSDMTDDDLRDEQAVAEVRQAAEAKQTKETKADTPKPASNAAQTSVKHKVAAGETINTIAEQYGVTPADIKEWNNLRRNAVRTGQQLKIYTAQAPAKADAKQQKADTKQQKADAKQTKVDAKQTKADAKQAKADARQQKADTKMTKAERRKQQQAEAAKANKRKNKKKQQAAPKDKNVEVKSGDNLSKIAKKNGVTVEELRKANPNLKGDMLHPGDKVKVPAKQAEQQKSKSKKRKRK